MSEGLRNSAEEVAEVEAAVSLILAMYRRNLPERVVSKYKPDKRCRVPPQHFDSRVSLQNYSQIGICGHRAASMVLPCAHTWTGDLLMVDYQGKWLDAV
jgi:hypothetical protein